MKKDMYELPDSLYDFAQIPDFHRNIAQLAGMAEQEDWTYHKTKSQLQFPILENYVNNTYKRIAIEKKISYSKDNNYCCFDTGLVTRSSGEPIYMMFRVNNNPQIDCFWHFDKFVRLGEHEMNSRFEKVPEMAMYWEDPSKIIYDPRKDLNVNVEHIIQDNKERFPEPYASMDDYNLQIYLSGCVENTEKRLKRNYKLAVPQYFFTSNTIQLLLPLCIAKREIADLAIVVEDYGNMYRASTCLTLDMAINNARLLARPDRDWLNP